MSCEGTTGIERELRPLCGGPEHTGRSRQTTAARKSSEGDQEPCQGDPSYLVLLHPTLVSNMRLSGESHSHLAGKCLIRPLGEEDSPQPIRALFPRPLIKPTLRMTSSQDHF